MQKLQLQSYKSYKSQSRAKKNAFKAIITLKGGRGGDCAKSSTVIQ